MNDVAVNNYREKFEEVMRRKGFTDEDLDYYCLTEQEKVTHPLRGDFHSYKNRETALLFSAFVEGANIEATRLDWLYKNGMSQLDKEVALGKDVRFINFRRAIDNKINQEKKSENAE